MTTENTLPPQLLCTRRQLAAMLGGVSIDTIRRLEQQEVLTPIRLFRSPSAQVYFRLADVQALIGERTRGR